MTTMIIITEGKTKLDDTFDAHKIIGKRVLSKNGIKVGRVKEIRVNPVSAKIEGFVVSQGFLAKTIYIGINYCDRLSTDGVILSMDPVIFLKDKKVVASTGEVIGKVVEVNRKGTTNAIESLTVRAWLRGTFNVPNSAIKYPGHSIILNSSFNAPKKRLFKRSK